MIAARARVDLVEWDITMLQLYVRHSRSLSTYGNRFEFSKWTPSLPPTLDEEANSEKLLLS